ncbi:MAG: hypothetical protein C5B51_16175 [Terriglobia bacterium]|nr:MAG: hypothetical protein C5B51_16175 [Terriglobia bacterium]
MEGVGRAARQGAGESLTMETPAKPRVLFVDDEPDLLAGLARTLRSELFEITTATNAAAALELLHNSGPFAVIVSDLRMPEMDGVTLLRSARLQAPDAVRILFTGRLDMERAVAAVNEGEIFRFLTKPCPRITMALTLKSAIEQHRLITAERVLLEQTLHGSIRALTETLALASPLAFGRATRLRKWVGRLAAALQISQSWHIEVAAMLSQIGCVIVPPDTLERVYRGDVLSESENAMMCRVPGVIEQILGNIPRLEPVREILDYQQKHFDGTGPPDNAVAGEAIPWGARALKIVLDEDALESSGAPVSLAIDTLRGRKGWYDPVILVAFAEILESEQRSEVRELPLASLRPGMILAQDVRTKKGIIFIARGQEVTDSVLEKLKNFEGWVYGEDSIRVIVRGTRPGQAPGV